MLVYLKVLNPDLIFSETISYLGRGKNVSYKKNHTCDRCLKKRRHKIKRDKSLRQKIEKNVNIEFDDFLDLGQHYFWNLEWIDPFTGFKILNVVPHV